MYYVYILKSDLDGSYYIGYTSDLERRLQFHNSGRGRYTRKKMPWKRVYYESFADKSEAIKRERYLKSMKSRVFIEELIAKGID